MDGKTVIILKPQLYKLASKRVFQSEHLVFFLSFRITFMNNVHDLEMGPIQDDASSRGIAVGTYLIELIHDLVYNGYEYKVEFKKSIPESTKLCYEISIKCIKKVRKN
jgi:hypothetical protein